MLRKIAAVLLALPLATVGCGGPTYVNVPAQPGDTAFNDANGDVVRAVAAAAVKGMLLEKQVAAPIAVKLPEGATLLTHADVARRIGPDAISPYEEGVEASSVVEVREIRIRGNNAEVDVLAPGPQGLDQLTSVRLSWAPFAGGWQADNMRTWRAGAQNVMSPTNVAPPEAP